MYFLWSAFNAIDISSRPQLDALCQALVQSWQYLLFTFGGISEVEMGHFDFVVVKVDVPAYSRGSEPLVKVVIQIVPKTLQGESAGLSVHRVIVELHRTPYSQHHPVAKKVGIIHTGNI